MCEDAKYQRLAPIVKEIKELKEMLGCGSQEAYNYFKKCRNQNDLYLLKQRIIPFETEALSTSSENEPSEPSLLLEGALMLEESEDDRLTYEEEMDWQLFMYACDSYNRENREWQRARHWGPIVARARRMDRRKD